ncbi:MAG: hypothetical protein ABW252_18850 [Polyangiales bacterium]
MSTRKILLEGPRLAVLLFALVSVLLGCSDDDTSSAQPGLDAGVSPATPGTSDGGLAPVGIDGATQPGRPARYAVQSVLFSPEGTTAYVSILRSTGPQTIDYAKAIELAGWGDLWVHEGRIYLSSGDGPVITRYELGDDDSLKETGKIGFADYGVTDAAFYMNTFVAPDKAYILNSAFEYVIWNPQTMTITGTVPLPQLEDRPGLKPRTGTIDRANVVHQGKLYSTMYWSDDEYVTFAPDSRVVVIDIATDKVERTLDVACAGLDVGTVDDRGNVWFSTWTSGVLEPLVQGKRPNCIAQIPAGSTAINGNLLFRDLAEGREGASLRSIGGGGLVVSIFHQERVQLAGAADPGELLGTENWKVWRYDLATGKAAPLPGAPDNAGAVYTTFVDAKPFLLIPGADYEKSTIWAVENGVATRQFETRGWATRLFRVP